MPVNGFTVGKDVYLDIVTQIGAARFNIRTSFQSKQNVDKRKSKGMDGTTRHIFLPDGWEGSFKFDRNGPSIDDFFAQREAQYYAGQPILSATITETISEQDGTISQFMYTGVEMAYDDAGEKKGDDITKQTISFMASKRLSL